MWLNLLIPNQVREVTGTDCIVTVARAVHSIGGDNNSDCTNCCDRLIEETVLFMVIYIDSCIM